MWFRLEVRLNSQGHYLWQQQFRHNRSEFGRWSENYHHTKKGSPLYILTRHVQHFMCPTFLSLTPSKNFHLIYQLSSFFFFVFFVRFGPLLWGDIFYDHLLWSIFQSTFHRLQFISLCICSLIYQSETTFILSDITFYD